MRILSPRRPRIAPALVSLGLVAGLTLGVSACSRNGYVWYDQLPPTSSDARLNLIKPGDKVSVFVDQHPDMTGIFDISSSGDYPQPLAGNIVLSGQSPDQAAQTIRVQLSRFVQAPTVRVSIVLPGPNRVLLMGEVAKVGPLSLAYDEGVLGAIANAGGLSQFANPDAIFVVRTKPRAMRIRFRYDDLLEPNPRATTFMLQDGDVIVVE
jgi:polysaccharide biosynthesis/export protein